MNWIDPIYAFLSLADAALLIFWGALDLRRGHRRDALFLMALGLCGLGAYTFGHYREKLLDAEIEAQKSKVAAAMLEQGKIHAQEKTIEKENLELVLKVGQEQDKRIEVEKTLQAFKTLTQFSDEALAGSFPSYNNLKQLAQDKSELGQRAQEQITYLQRELAYYEQPPGIVLALDLSMTIDGKQVRLLELPTQNLFKLLQDETIMNNTRFSLMNDICHKPENEVDRYALEVLKSSKYLPALAVTTSILRRLHKNAIPFMDITGWQTYLENEGHL